MTRKIKSPFQHEEAQVLQKLIKFKVYQKIAGRLQESVHSISIKIIQSSRVFSALNKQYLSLATMKASVRLDCQYREYFRVAKGTLFIAELSGAISPAVVVHVLKKTGLAGI